MTEEMSRIRIAMTGGSALVGDGLERIGDATILIDGERVEAVAPSAQMPVPSGWRVVDVTGQTVAPGFIDAHVHIGFADPAEVVARGVTTVRDLGWPPDDIFPLAAGSRAAGSAGPEIVAAGPILTAPAGYPTRAAWAPEGTGLEVADPGAARAAVDSIAERGATVIKIALNPPVGPTFEPHMLRAIVAAAETHGLKVTGHIYGLDELEKALDAGVHELAHMLMSDETIPETVLRRMVDQGVVVVPTLSVRFGHDRATAIENLAGFRALGGTIVYGTDLGNEGPGPGIERAEVAAMAEAGMSALDIIRSATVTAAQWLRLKDRGRLVPGALADLVAFGGDVRSHEDLTKVTRVWRRGIERSL